MRINIRIISSMGYIGLLDSFSSFFIRDVFDITETLFRQNFFHVFIKEFAAFDYYYFIFLREC